ncbi:uncharacterized protein BDZ99DRAFT_405449 [Mytilinidion resinicola]|uniref:C2H2-type domain-containing protein n=1 Tax=Mytilinidion resinicola TaxID=574789 RepID=A0A6A6ZA96_9PEZI|nr:uncharacterized protein BDZ99DRAFT_405449 [Mytilinidion resinicola]KAF2817653.1 hypothetical protein BDZ99DRAFT_405449 [Mytilinidion resinicola]
MAGHISETFTLKDDDVSVSSMGDSAYQSQPDANRRVTTVTEGFRSRSSQDSKGHMFDPYLGGSLYSPALSSDSQSGFNAPQSDMSQMLLPPSAGDSDMGNEVFNFANYSTGQGYGPHQNSSVPQYFSSANEMDAGHQWATADLPSFTTPFAVRNVDANALLPFRQQQQSSRDSMSQHFYPPFMYANQEGTSNAFGMSMNAPHSRPRVRRPQVDTTSTSDADAVRSSTPLSAGRRVSITDQMFQSFVMSPTSSVLSMPQRASIAESDFTEQSSFNKTENNVSFDDSVTAPSVKDDDFDDDIFSPSQSSAAQASLEEAEGKLARTHPLYQAQPKEDELYHCPNEGQAGCTHKPTKLKCNYDKYVDSHLRPFRCKVKTCVGVRFSSTACLLRHEREAHGMHGHGSKPHLCTYQDCERSVPGHGFPRRYNLFDHMKRVHDYTGSTSPSENVSPPVQSAHAPLKRKSSSRKRKTLTQVDEMTEKRQKTANRISSAAAAAASEQNRLNQERKNLMNEWTKRRATVVLDLQGLQGPKDMNSHFQVSEDLAALSKIASRLNELG